MAQLEPEPMFDSPIVQPDMSALHHPNYCGLLERMPKWLICIPLGLQWILLALRYGSPTLPSAANPAITSGGLVGEGKLEYFHGMGATARTVTAPWYAISTHRVPSARELRQGLADAGLTFPIIAKPNLGLCGYGVRRLNSLAALLIYLIEFPADEVVVVQQYLTQENEAGIFYARDPQTQEGRIIGLALRYGARVVGDGRHTLAELIARDPRACRMMRSPQHERPPAADRVPASGEVVRLATINSTRVGGLYRDGEAHITPALTAAMDAIARDMPGFHCGRFDVRFSHLHELRAGVGFTIMEVNGAGSEAIQAWDPDIGIARAFSIIFAKQRMLFAIGAAQRHEGVKAIGLLVLAQLYLRQQRLIALYPPSN